MSFLTPAHDVSSAVGAATSAAGSQIAQAATGGLLSSLGINPSSIVSGLVHALLYVVLLLAGAGLVLLGVSRLTGNRAPELITEAAGAAAAA